MTEQETSSRVAEPFFDSPRGLNIPYVPQGYLMYRTDKEFSRLEQKFLFIPVGYDHTFSADIKGFYELRRLEEDNMYLDKTGKASLEITVNSRRLNIEEAVDKFIKNKEELDGVTIDYEQITKFIRSMRKEALGRNLFPGIPDYARGPVNTIWEMYFRMFD